MDIHSECLRLCTESPQEVRLASRSLAGLFASASATELSRYIDQLLAALGNILMKPHFALGLKEEVLGALALLLERADVDAVEQRRRSQVFPHVVERILFVLENMDNNREVGVAAMRCADAALERWYTVVPAKERDVEMMRLQLGYLAHMAVQLLSSNHRDACARSSRVLQLLAQVTTDLDTLACFYPGIVGALVKLLLHGDAKMGSRLFASLLDAWTIWMTKLLTDTKATAKILSLASIFSEFNMGMQSREGKSRVTDEAANKTAPAGKLPQVSRDTTWLAETSARTAEALCAVLQSTKSPLSSMWTEKAAVRRSAAKLCLAVLQDCRVAFQGEKVIHTCFEVLLGILLDDCAENRDLATAFLNESTRDLSTDAELWQKLMDHFLNSLQAALPGKANPQLDGNKAFKRSVNRAHAFIALLQDGDVRLGPEVSERIARIALRLGTLDSTPLKAIFEDEKPLLSLPSRGIGQAANFIELFPYEELAVAQGGHALAKEPPTMQDLGGKFGTAPADPGCSISGWLRLSLQSADSSVDTAKEVEALVGRLILVVPPELAFAVIFEDEGCAWHEQDMERNEPNRTDPHAVSGTDRMKRMTSRTAGMYVLSLWLNELHSERAAGLKPPLWLPLQCLNTALSMQSKGAPVCGRAETLLDVCASHLLRSCVQALAAAGESESSGGWQVHVQVKNLLIPLLVRCGSSSFASSTAAMSTLVTLEEVLAEDGRCKRLPNAPLQGLLSSYSDYIVGHVCFNLKYSQPDGSARDVVGSRLGAIMVAAVQHVDVSMVPFLRDSVHAVLHASPAASGTLEFWQPKPGWVLRVLASVAQQLASFICADRMDRQLERAAASKGVGEASSLHLSVVQAFLSGQQKWKPATRRDGFHLSDLGILVDEDAEVLNEDENDDIPNPTTLSRHGCAREIVGSIALWARNHLQADSIHTRHLAHLAIVHCLTVLSTRVRELLPCVHDVWASLVPSFQLDTPLAVFADGCVLLKHCARVSGDFVCGRFVADCWPGLWQPLKEQDAVLEEAAFLWSAKLKAQVAALDALVFLAGDSALVSVVAEQLVAIALKFLGEGVAARLRQLAKALLTALVPFEADVLWLYISTLSEEESDEMDALPLLAEVGIRKVPVQDLKELEEALLQEDRSGCPRVSLGLAGQIWEDALFKANDSSDAGG